MACLTTRTMQPSANFFPGLSTGPKRTLPERSLREHQAAAAAAYDQRDKERVASMWGVVRQLDDALAVWETNR